MKPLTISCLSEYRKGVFGAVFWLLIDVVFLLLEKAQFSHPRFADFVIIILIGINVIEILTEPRFQILDENGITVKRIFGSTTYKWDYVSGYEVIEVRRGLNFKKRTVIRVLFEGSPPIGLKYSEDALAWMHHRCDISASDKPSP